MRISNSKDANQYIRYLDAELCLTQELILPLKNGSLEIVTKHQSEQLNTPNHNLRQAIYQQLMRQQQMQAKEQRKLIFTRQSFSVLNKKQRDIRKNNYLLTPQRSSSKEKAFQNQGLLIAREASFTRVDSANAKRPISSSSTRQLQGLHSKNQLQRAKTARTARTSRPPTSYSKISKQAEFKSKKQFEFRQQNPLVIYPFESRLKAKRIDDNPKILANIITKKNKTMEKAELYSYVSKLMSRRPK